MNLKLEEAVKILCEELEKDKSEGSYYYSWQANIAMAFQDEFWRSFKEEDEELFLKIDSSFIHTISNNAAKNFLDLLIYSPLNNVISVAEKLYYEANPSTQMDVPSFAYEQVEKANKRRISTQSKLTLYDWCKEELNLNKNK